MLQASDGRSQAAAIAARVARLFLRFPSSRLKDSESEATIAAYAFDLAAYPLWAIDQAIIEAIQKGGSFVPSSPELRTACERMVSRVRLEAAGIRAVLNAEVYHEPSAEERRRVAEAFDELVADLKLRTDYERPPQARPLTRVEAQEWLDRYQQEQPPMPKLSPAARRASGLPEQGEEAA